jgi:hypothetical protein
VISIVVFAEGPPPRLSKKQKRQLTALECSLSPDMRHVTSTVALKPSGFDLEANVTSSHNPYEMNEEMYKALLVNHKRRRMEADVCLCGYCFCIIKELLGKLRTFSP